MRQEVTAKGLAELKTLSAHLTDKNGHVANH